MCEDSKLPLVINARINSIRIAKPIDRTPAKSGGVVYIYRAIHELFNYHENGIPSNSNTQIVGVYGYCPETNRHYVKSHDRTCCARKDKQVKLNVSIMPKWPCPGDRVTVYGSLHFEDSEPVLVGRFYQRNECDFYRWANTMLLVRTLAPRELLDKVDVREDRFDVSRGIED